MDSQMNKRLALISPVCNEMRRRACDRLASMDELPEAVRKFELTDYHELDVIEALERLLGNSYEEKPTERGSGTTSSVLWPIAHRMFDEYRGKASQEDYRVLRWALLLHDIAKDRHEPDRPHPEVSAEIANIALPSDSDPHEDQYYLSDDDRECVLWLIKHHDVLGNVYTGERSPAFLLDTIADHEIHRERLLRLLQVVMLCDLRGTTNGIYLTEQKAEFWLQFSSKTGIEKQKGCLLDVRLERWTGNLAGTTRPRRCRILRNALRADKKTWGLVEHAFGERITHIENGFYLFTALSRVQLAKLMKRIALAADFAPDGGVRLSFKPRYRPPSVNDSQEVKETAARVLGAYKKQIDRGSLRLVINASLHSGSARTSADKGNTIYCYAD